MTRILLTGVGAPGTLGTVWALRHNFDGEDVLIVGTDTNPKASGRGLCDVFELLPWPEDQTYEGERERVEIKHDVDAVLIQTTREARRRGLTQATDKAYVSHVHASLGYHTATSFHARTTDDLKRARSLLGPRFVLKPECSNGSRGVRFIVPDPYEDFPNDKPGISRVEFHQFLNSMAARGGMPRLIAQEYLPGPEYTVDCFIGEHVSVAVPRRRLAIRSGITTDSAIEMRDDLIEMSLRAGEALGLSGAFGFQYKCRDDGTPCVLECNPRIQGTMVHAVLAGANLVWMDVREQMGRPVTKAPKILDGLRFQRLWGGITSNGVRV